MPARKRNAESPSSSGRPDADTGLPQSIHSFVEFFGELGPRWGLPRDACRVHAYLYVVAAPASSETIAQALALEIAAMEAALTYLTDYRMIEKAGPAGWRTGSDPWDMLAGGLEERRRRELKPALDTLRRCEAQALAGDAAERGAGQRIGRLVALVEDLAALDAHARRVSPRLLRGLVGLTGRAARFMNRTRSTSGGQGQ